MNTIQEYYDFLDSNEFDCNSKSKLDIELKNLCSSYMKKDEQESAILCEFERQILFINKSFEYKKDEAKGTVNGLSYMFAGTQTLEDGLEIPIYFPDVAKLTKSDFEYCEKRYKECNNLFMKTEYGLMVYFGRQTDYSKRNDFKSKLCNELFTLAKYYLVKVINDCENKYYNMDFLYTLKLAFGIAENNRLTNEINTLVEFSFDTHQNSNINKNGMIKIILDISCLMSYNFKFFKDKIDFNKVIEKNIEVVKELEKTDLFGAEHIINGVLKIQQQMNMSQANSLRYKAEIYEKLMKDGEENRKNNLVAVKFAEDALRIYKSLNDKNKIDELGRKYNDLRGKIQLTEHFSEFPEEYTQRVIEQIDATVKQSTEQDIIYHFIITLWYMKIADIQIQAEKMRKESLLTYLATTSILDKFGNTIETYKTDEEKIQQRFWDTYRINNQLGTQKMQRLFIEAYKARKLSYKSTMNYLENTWLNEPIIRDYHSNTVEIKPIDTLKPCLKRLFSELDFWLQENDYQIDCVTITDSLTLKIEQLLRNFCEKIGISTFKLRVKGGDNLVMEKLLDDILSDIKHSEENRTNFDEEDRIFIKYVLTEKSGLNLRNRIAHGLMDINEYSFENILLLFSIIMKLSKYKFTPITT